MPNAAPPPDLLFATRLYRAEIEDAGRLNEELAACCLVAAEEDEAGKRWCRQNGYPGYTSYASLNDLPARFPAMAELKALIDGHAQAMADLLHWDLGRAQRLEMNSLWINVLAPGGFHGSHLHPVSVLSGTYYVSVPMGSSAIRFEDPRLSLMMAAPPRRPDAPPESRAHVAVEPRPGTLLLWESWLRHEVPLNQARQKRISISFNYAWR